MMAANQAARSAYDPALHHRRSIRLRGHDYAAGGVYFVTLCLRRRDAGATVGAKNLSPLRFGTVVNGRMALNDAGRAAAACWRAIPDHFPNAALDEFVVMPDHVHGIIAISGRDAPTVPSDRHPRGTSRTLGSVVRGFKIGVTKSLGGDSPWQRNYYDIIIRDDRALQNIRRYIRDNPAHWDVEWGRKIFRPCMGDPALLDLPLTAFLASRPRAGGDGGGWGEKCRGERGERFFAPTVWPVRPACVISGFLSPMERAVFDACLADGTPMVWVLARDLPRDPSPRIRRAVDDGCLLILTPFDDSVTGFSAARAAWCNQYAMHLAANAVIGHLEPDGMLACLLADLRRDIPVRYLGNQPPHQEAQP